MSVIYCPHTNFLFDTELNVSSSRLHGIKKKTLLLMSFCVKSNRSAVYLCSHAFAVRWTRELIPLFTRLCSSGAEVLFPSICTSLFAKKKKIYYSLRTTRVKVCLIYRRDKVLPLELSGPDRSNWHIRMMLRDI